MTTEGILFLIVLTGVSIGFMGLLIWAERRTRKQDLAKIRRRPSPR